MHPYLKPDRWLDAPIEVRINDLTGLLDGNDGKNAARPDLSPGYRAVPDVPSNEEVVDLEVAGVYCTSDYDGITIFGTKDSARVLAGGVRGGKVLLRRYFAEGCVYLNRILKEYFAGQFELQGVDGYRSQLRCQKLFERMRREIAVRRGLNPEQMSPVQLIATGRAADETCSWVKVVEESAAPVVEELLKDSVFIVDLQAAIDGGVLKGSMEDAVLDYVTISANSGQGRGKHVETNASKSAHPGAGALDVLLRGRLNGRSLPLTHVPFDYASPLSGMTFLEKPENYDVYVATAKKDPILAAHLKLLGFEDPGDFKRSDWNVLVGANRVRYHLFMSAGGSFYDPGDPHESGENWHYQLGNMVYGFNGDVVIAEPTLSAKYPNAGNTCHTLLRCPAGPGRVAVRTGVSAYKLVETSFGHE